MRIEVLQAPTNFVFTWGTPGQEIRPDNSTTVSFSLESIGGATQLTVVETGFEHVSDPAARRQAMGEHASGWTSELDSLLEFAQATAGREAQ